MDRRRFIRRIYLRSTIMFMFYLVGRAMSQRMLMIELVPCANAPNQVDDFKVVCYLTLPFGRGLPSHLH